jgi:hypothetical protein
MHIVKLHPFKVKKSDEILLLSLDISKPHSAYVKDNKIYNMQCCPYMLQFITDHLDKPLSFDVTYLFEKYKDLSLLEGDIITNIRGNGKLMLSDSPSEVFFKSNEIRSTTLCQNQIVLALRCVYNRLLWLSSDVNSSLSTVTITGVSIPTKLRLDICNKKEPFVFHGLLYNKGEVTLIS